jgi:type IV secretion system protein VirD4
LNPDQAILIPERQNPLLVHRIVYFQDPTFKALFEAQAGPLPYPPKEAAAVQGLTARMEALERRLAEKMVVDFVRAEKPGSASAMAEPKLAAELMAAEKPILAQNGQSGEGANLPDLSGPEANLAAFRPDQIVAVARMRRFTRKIQELGA